MLAQHKVEAHSGFDDMRFWSWHEGVVDTSASIELRAEPEARVRGRVLDADGQPVPFIGVELEHARVQRSPRWITLAWSRPTDRDGRFAFEGVRALADDVRLSVAGRAGATASEPFRLRVGGLIDGIELRLARPGTVEGTVRDVQGAPIPGAAVWLRTWDFETGQQRDGSIAAVLADRRGRYRHLGVAPGGYCLEVLAEGGSVRGEPFAVGPGERVRRDP